MPAYATQSFNLSPQQGDVALLFGKQATVALAASPGGAVRNANVVTFTTSAAHHMVPGFQFIAQGVGSVGGTQLNGLYQILTVPSATTLTAQPIQPGPSGTASSPGNQNQANDTGGGGSITGTQAELLQPSVPIASIAVGFQPLRGQSPSFTYEVFFDGAPGAFSLQLQEGNLEGPGGNASGYVTPTQAAYTTTAVNANNYASADLIPTGGAFLRALLNSLTNNVGIIVRLRRIQ